MTQQRLKTQVLVIGAGISGSTSALTLADAGYEVTLIVPGKEMDGGNSALAQGGIVYRPDPDDAKDLEKDILVAGHHHNYVTASTASCTAPTTPGRPSWKAYCRPCACLRTSAS